jgi:hypothetical protein
MFQDVSECFEDFLVWINTRVITTTTITGSSVTLHNSSSPLVAQWRSAQSSEQSCSWMKVLPDSPFIALIRHKEGIGRLTIMDFQMPVCGATFSIRKSRF